MILTMRDNRYYVVRCRCMAECADGRHFWNYDPLAPPSEHAAKLIQIWKEHRDTGRRWFGEDRMVRP